MNKPKHQPKQEDNNDSGFDDVAAVLPEAQGGHEVLDAGEKAQARQALMDKCVHKKQN